MLPGYVSGFYTHDECHVDLNRLARYAGAALILEAAVGLDLQVCIFLSPSQAVPISNLKVPSMYAHIPEPLWPLRCTLIALGAPCCMYTLPFCASSAATLLFM